MKANSFYEKTWILFFHLLISSWLSMGTLIEFIRIHRPAECVVCNDIFVKLANRKSNETMTDLQRSKVKTAANLSRLQ